MEIKKEARQSFILRKVDIAHEKTHEKDFITNDYRISCFSIIFSVDGDYIGDGFRSIDFRME